MKRLIGFVIGLGLLTAACAGQGAVDIPPLDDGGSSPSATPNPPSPSPTGGSNGSPNGSGGGQTVTYEVWFTRGEHLFVTKRTQPFTVAVGRAALTAMLQGPSDAEAAAGVGTVIPDGTELLGLNIEDGIATVDLSGEYDDGGGSLSMRMRLAQVVYTISQFDTVQGVDFRLDGDPVETFSGEGIVLEDPQTRADYEDLLPAITVSSPVIGQRVSSPVTIAGTANVFEATVSIWILDEDGDRIVETFVTATCGTGCRGDYSARVGYEVDHDQPGTIQVFEASAQDGRPTKVVKIPVTLTA
jgi:Immunoglobulin-like domain of bacterial spore germination/Sporulation and spore germination